MNDIMHFFIGMFVGATVVGSSVHRTLSVHNGDVIGGIWGSVWNSIAYYFSVYYIAKDNHVAYFGTALGSTLVVIYMALRKGKYTNDIEDASRDNFEV